MTDTQLKDIVVYLEQHGYNCLFNEDDETILINISICKKDIQLKCDFPVSFPYSFPKIYLQEDSLKVIVPLPHVDKDGFICTFENNVSFPNSTMPHELVFESVKKAVKIITDGIEGLNQDDFIEEFKAYWDIDAGLSANTLFNVNEQPQLLYYFRDKALTYFIGNDRVQLTEYIHIAKGVDVGLSEFERCIYLPLDLKWIPPYPKTNSEIYLKVKQNRECFNFYYGYLKNRTKQSVVLFSQIINGSRCLAGWMHMPVRTPPGFRKGKIHPSLVYMGSHKSIDVLKINATQLDQKRLFFRGGDGNLISEAKISVTGCGSIGSYLIQGFSELGMSDFTLIDKEGLSSENIARHICGVSFIGQNKATAMRKILINHYPDIKCNALPLDVFQVINNEITVYNNCDYNFIVVGNKPIEAKFIELLNKKSIYKTTVLIWVEPFLLGGHAVILQEGQEVQSLLYDCEYNFLHSVLTEGHKYTKKESGCQSSFIPYSGFEARQFVYSFIDYFNNTFINGKKDGNYLFSWCGKLTWARKENIPISDKWLSKDDRTKIVTRIG